MIQEITISGLDELLPLLTEQEYRPDLNRNRSSFLYRGMPNSSFKMTTSLRRNCKDLQQTLEPAILENFAKYAIHDDPSIGGSVWRQMILGQHHGLPTRLLDWTHSALVGLHFAMSEENNEDLDAHDCMVWRIDMAEMVSLLPENYQQLVNRKSSTIFSVDMLREITGNSLVQYDRDMKDSAMVIIEPPSVNSRIINQYSFFAVVPTDLTDIEGFLDSHTTRTVKYIIPKELRWRVRDMLDQLNMSERIVYPGLDGLSKWISRHYYVKGQVPPHDGL
ncbi:MAG: FRG domain-containing protein [Lachnospiraceae bacterium]|nr:FRG domain-containing protein [Lachnospiraceae bacterium]